MKRVLAVILIIGSVVVTASACSKSAPPEADFSCDPDEGDVPLAVEFTDESTGEITSWAWDFDDNGEADSTEQNPTYEYESAGTYTVSLKVAGPGGSDTETRTDLIEVFGLPFSVVVVNQDEGYAIPPSSTSVSISAAIIANLDSEILEVEMVSTEAEGVELVESGDAYGVIIFPKDFTYNVYQNMIDPSLALDTKIRVRLDKTNVCVACAIKEEVGNVLLGTWTAMMGVALPASIDSSDPI
jgi:hypothetical protein